MIELIVEPIVAHTIYKGGRSAEEDYARRHPQATVSFMLDWKRHELEQFTYLDPEAAHSFMDMQTAWLAAPGERNLVVSDALRPINQQIDLKRRKPGLAAKPGTSLHGLALAIDYDTEALGVNEQGRKLTFVDFHAFIQPYGWAVHDRAFRSKRHAEAWHIEYRGWPCRPFGHQMELINWLMAKHADSVIGDEEAIVNQIAGRLGVTALAYPQRVQAVQRMGGLNDDGVVGPKTRGYLALLTITHKRVKSTYKPGGGGGDGGKSDAAPKRTKKAGKVGEG